MIMFSGFKLNKIIDTLCKQFYVYEVSQVQAKFAQRKIGL